VLEWRGDHGLVGERGRTRSDADDRRHGDSLRGRQRHASTSARSCASLQDRCGLSSLAVRPVPAQRAGDERQLDPGVLRQPMSRPGVGLQRRSLLRRRSERPPEPQGDAERGAFGLGVLGQRGLVSEARLRRRAL